MANYVFHTNLSIEECVERFHTSVYEGSIWWPDSYLKCQEYDFAGKLRDFSFKLARIDKIQLGRNTSPRINVAWQFYGKFLGKAQGATIKGRLRVPLIIKLSWTIYFTAAAIFGAIVAATIGSVLFALLTGRLFEFGQAELNNALAFSGAYILITVLPLVFGLRSWRRLKHKHSREIITFIQRTFEAELIEPSPITGAADVR
jgi:hypothetical protein